jgi:hypothetical protein
VNGYESCTGLFADGKGIADMITVIMRDKNKIHMANLINTIGCGRVTADKRVNKHSFRTGNFDC